MRRLVCVFDVRIWHKTGVFMTWLILFLPNETVRKQRNELQGVLQSTSAVPFGNMRTSCWTWNHKTWTHKQTGSNQLPIFLLRSLQIDQENHSVQQFLQYLDPSVIVVVVLVFYALRHFSCHLGRGQLTYPHCSWANLIGSLPVLSAHTFVTDNCPPWISRMERMAIEMMSWPMSTKECCRTWGSNPRSSVYQADAHPTELPRPADPTIKSEPSLSLKPDPPACS